MTDEVSFWKIPESTKNALKRFLWTGLVYTFSRCELNDPFHSINVLLKDKSKCEGMIGPAHWLAVCRSVGLSMSENVGKEFSVCVISVICHCLPVQYGELFCRLHHGLTRPRVQQINNTFVKVISFKSPAFTWRAGQPHITHITLRGQTPIFTFPLIEHLQCW